jgi:hypothetical protein
MVDRHSRDALATAIEDYLLRQIDNGNLERRMFALRTSDSACLEIARQMTFFSSEYRRHMNDGSAQISVHDSTIIERWLAFLRSEMEWPIAKEVCSPMVQRLYRWIAVLFARQPNVPQFRVNEYWPLRCREEWIILLDGAVTAR